MNLAKQVIAEELRLFETHFKDAVRSRVALLDRIMQYIVKRKGKQMRPMFVLLSARLGGPVTDRTFRAASLVELVHTATLVHDDVVDDSMERRGFFSINALWKNKVAVLVGDYLLSKGLLLSLGHRDYQVLEILTEAFKLMSEGELLQFEKSRKLNLDESVYYDIIKGKTASLLASACAAGASTTIENADTVEKVRVFGEKVGMAFQVKDDLFDYGMYHAGKPTGNDIKEKKLTLPLIYTLNNTDAETRRKLIYIVKNENTKKEKVKWLMETVERSGGIRYAENKMNSFRDEALELLYTFPPSDVRNALEELVRFTTDRQY